MCRCGHELLYDVSDSACAQDENYCKKEHSSVRKLIFMVVLIPEDKLTYQIMPCNSIHNSFLDYIRIYAVMIFQLVSIFT